METLHLPLSTPVIIGRDDLLALGRRRVASARAGDGHVLFLAGEAGIGKTRLLGAVVREAARQGMRVMSAGTSPRDLEVPAALLLDLGHRLGRSKVAAERDAGSAILERLSAVGVERVDPHRRRRVMVLEMADSLAALAAGGPVTLALEDLHWADDLALEVLGQLARRIGSLPFLIVGTYRSDELYPRLPMREWRARLLTQRLAEEARLARLTREQTGAMIDQLLPGPLPAPTKVVLALHERSDGIPLHVEEILGAMRLDVIGDRPRIPDTLADAVLARREALSREAARVADAAAVINRSFDLEFLAAVADRPLDGAAAALGELEARYFVEPTGVAGWFDFRHVLIRDVLEGAMSLARRRTAHERVAAHAAARPELADDGFLSTHFEAAGRRQEAFHHARAAAARAVSLSAHREALDLYRRAVRSAPADVSSADRAALHAAQAAEEAATDDNAAAAASYSEARRLLLADGRADAAAGLLPKLVAARHLLGDSLEARIKLLNRGFQELRERAEETSGRPVQTRLEAALSAAYMLDRRLDEALEHGQRAIRLAAEVGDSVTEIDARVTQGATLVFAGRLGEGWAALEQSIRETRAARLETEAARAYRMIGTSASVLVEYDRAERWLREGIAYSERTEQWNHRHYMAAHLGHVLWAVGEWDGAVEVTQHAMADGRGGITTRITSLHVIGYLALGRGDWDAAESALNEARAMGDEMCELQRFSPAVWGLAEMAQLRGDHAAAAELSDVGRRASMAVRDAAYLFPYLVTGTRARLALADFGAAESWLTAVGAALRERSIPGTLPSIDHAGGLVALAHGRTGQARELLTAARHAWKDRRRTWEWANVTLDLARCVLRANRPAEAASLVRDAIAWAEPRGATPILVEARELEATIRGRGVREERWAPLTAREFEVATLIAAGRTNREIGAQLTISPKTVASHVEHILGRLGADRRTEIAAWVASVQAD